jgi:NifU-like protein involved in Fe-S cluster formation
MIYDALTLRYFADPTGVGVLHGGQVRRGAAGSRERGTWVQFDLQIEQGLVQAARFLAFGCPHVIAAASWTAEHAPGRSIDSGPPAGAHALRERFAVPVEKLGKLLIIEDAWAAAWHATPANQG